MLWVAVLAASFAVTAPAVVDSITISGNERTDASVISGEISSRTGAPYRPAVWNADLQAVKDLGIFWSAEATSAVDDGRAALHLRVREKWTLLPIVQYTQTSDAYQWTLGAWDSNLLGYGMEGGVKLIRKRAGTSYDVWLFQPRAGRGPHYFRIATLNGDRVYFVYPRRGADVAPAGYYAETRVSADVEFGRRLDDAGERRLGVYYGPYASRFGLLDHTRQQRAANAASRFTAPPARVAHRVGLKASLGRVHYDDYVYTGGRLDAGAWETIVLGRAAPPFARWEAQYRHFWSPRPRHNVALRAVAGGTGSARIEDAFFVGGLEEVRGFPDQRFAGRYAAYVNAEYRYPAVDNRWVMLQAVALSDAGAVWNGFAARERPRASWAAGVGLHALVKPVQRLVVRLDVVRSIEPFARNEFSLGFKEFIDSVL